MKKIEQKDLFELKNVGQPVVAGDAFFFTETKMNEKKNTYETAIYKYTADGNVAYGDEGTVNSSLKVSPDGKWISFISNAGEEKTPQLKIQSVQGGNQSSLKKQRIVLMEEHSYQTMKSHKSKKWMSLQKKEQHCSNPKNPSVFAMSYIMEQHL